MYAEGKNLSGWSVTEQIICHHITVSPLCWSEQWGGRGGGSLRPTAVTWDKGRETAESWKMFRRWGERDKMLQTLVSVQQWTPSSQHLIVRICISLGPGSRVSQNGPGDRRNQRHEQQIRPRIFRSPLKIPFRSLILRGKRTNSGVWRNWAGSALCRSHMLLKNKRKGNDCPILYWTSSSDMEWIEQQIHKLHFLVIDQIGRKSSTSMLMFCLRIVSILPQKRQFLVHETLF